VTNEISLVAEIPPYPVYKYWITYSNLVTMAPAKPLCANGHQGHGPLKQTNSTMQNMQKRRKRAKPSKVFKQFQA
jgi:hypothetical protein